ncbi:MMPL family transporter [Roseomonas sp. NAR14]|uniref:MMPL family transporter n=1 Tax=Roseomonas acroporae TaxID=2937791 RepID=A0A9X2BVD0_9PROT|nr:MMPL family transporter [Roseomonas acroporae]MCK8784931.1 MMPL family transporter [Roseomonas acroporae]
MTRLLLVLLLLGAGLAALFRTTPLSGDMAAFLPPGRSAESAFLFRELRSGAATTLLLAGIEGAPPAELARLSRAVGDTLRASDRFALVGNGAFDLSERELDLLFRHRYLLSPAVSPALFETETLRAKLRGLIEGLRSSLSPLLVRFGLADPVGAFLALAQGWIGASRVQLREGVWFADTPDGPRALLVARTRAAGLDVEAQSAAVALLRQAFAAANPGPARLLVSGPGVFAAEAAAAIKADVHLISVASGLLLLAFLLWRYRSPGMLLAMAVPLLAATLAGALAVRLAFGTIHGAAFGFGMTMLGVTVDYPILLVTLRRPGEPLAATARRIWPTLRLAAAAAALGLTAMLFSGFGGLSQLGLFAAAGLAAGAATTRWVLPHLVPGEGAAAGPAASAGGPAPGWFAIRPRPLPAPLLRALLALPRFRALGYGAIALAALGLLLAGGPREERDLNALNPVPQASRDLDLELRAQLGAPDVRTLLVLRGDSAEAVLRQSERLAAALAPLVGPGRAVESLDLPSRFLPSEATQRARQAVLPEAATLRARLAEAAAGLPFRAGAFDRFLAAVAESRTMAPLTPEALAAGSPLLAARLDPLLARREDGWIGLAIPAGLRDPAALRAALAPPDLPPDALPGLLFIDTKTEMEGVLGEAMGQALRWVAVGGAGVLLLLGAGLGAARPVLRCAVPVGGALLVTIAILSAAGLRLTPFHLVSLLLLAGVAMDYALFLARSGTESHPRDSQEGPPSGDDIGERGRTLESVLNCAAATLLSFGLLALCGTPVLRGIGLTVSLGVTVAFLLACTLVPPGARPGAPPGAPRAAAGTPGEPG